MNEANEVARGSSDRFGYEWSTYDSILPESKRQLENWLGSTGLKSFAGKRVLDVGCGMGRNPYWMIAEGKAARLIAVDIDDGSLKSARKNLAVFPNAEVKKVSAYDVGMANLGEFDRVTCIGVLHHLASPPKALKSMWSCVAPGGDLVLWCYGKEGNRLLLGLIQTLRVIGSKLPIRVTHGLAKLITVFAYPAFRYLPWKTEYYANLKKLSYQNLESIIFDQMIPHIAHYWTRNDMTNLVKSLGGENFIEFVQGNSWHVRIQKKCREFST